MNTKIAGLGSFIMLVSLTSANQAHATAYTFTDLSTQGGTSSSANAINNLGQVAGWAQTAGGEVHATVWNGTTPTDLGTLGGTRSIANGINDVGQVVGGTYITDEFTSRPRYGIKPRLLF